MASGSCTSLQQCAYEGAWHGYNTTKSHYVGYNYNSVYYPFILQFTIPSFTGKGTALTFNLSMLQGNRNDAASPTVALRWALCRSDSNKDSYRTNTAVSDSNQITSGTITFDGLTSAYSLKTLTVNTTELTSGTTYYLFLWGTGGYSQDYAIANTAVNHSVTLEYTSTVTIDEYHYGLKAGGGYELLGITSHTATYGEAFTPIAETGHAAYTSKGSTYQLWNAEHTVIVVTGKATGIDSFVVDGTYSTTIDVFYQLRTYTLSISAGTGSTVTVKRGSETLANGAIIAYGDVLTISFAAGNGYALNTHTVNGSTFSSGGIHTVTGDVTIIATATKNTYTLSISAGIGSTVAVKRGSETLANGAAVTVGDNLTISFSAAEGYSLTAHTVNGADFASGGSHTVVGDVTVVATAFLRAYQIGGKLYHAYIGNKKYTAYIGDADGKPLPYGNTKPMENN